MLVQLNAAEEEYPAVGKCGVHIASDVTSLRYRYPSLEVKNTIDLAALAQQQQQRRRQQPGHREEEDVPRSLKGLFEHFDAATEGVHFAIQLP